MSRTNMMKRMKQIISIVNHEISEYKGIESENKIIFELSQDLINRMFKDVHNNIISWKGVDLNSCEKQKNSFKEYNRTCLNWFNRNKAKIYGNHFFYPLIFIHILNVCIHLFMYIQSLSSIFVLYPLDIVYKTEEKTT